jgi:hypothetical protein
VAGAERDYDAMHAALGLPWRKASHAEQNQQAQDAQARDIVLRECCSAAATALARRLTVESLLGWCR